jgi:hypothetical protein
MRIALDTSAYSHFIWIAAATIDAGAELIQPGQYGHTDRTMGGLPISPETGEGLGAAWSRPASLTHAAAARHASSSRPPVPTRSSCGSTSASAWPLVRVERDAFAAAAGYPPGRFVDGIRLLDRVWLDFTW